MIDTANPIFKVEQELVGGYFDFLTGTAFPNNAAASARNNVEFVIPEAGDHPFRLLWWEGVKSNRSCKNGMD